MAKKLFVGGLSWGTDNAGLQTAFERFGEVQEAVVINDRETGRSRGFGFVTFVEDADADAAIAGMNEQTLDGRQIRVHEANERERRPSPHQGERRFDGPRRDGPRADGPRRDGPRLDGPRRDGPRHDGPRHDGPRRDGPRHDGPRHDGPRHDGPRHDGPRRDGPPPQYPERGGYGGARGGWDLAPPDDFGGGKRDRQRRADRGGGRDRDRHDDTWTAHERPSRSRPRPQDRDEYDDE